MVPLRKSIKVWYSKAQLTPKSLSCTPLNLQPHAQRCDRSFDLPLARVAPSPPATSPRLVLGFQGFRFTVGKGSGLGLHGLRCNQVHTIYIHAYLQKAATGHIDLNIHILYMGQNCTFHKKESRNPKASRLFRVSSP